MKKLFVLLLILSAFDARSQNTIGFCISVNCPVTIQLPLDSTMMVSLVSVPAGDTLASLSWTATAGTLSAPNAAQTWIKGLTKPGTYTFPLTATTKHGAILTNATETVNVIAAAPPRTVASVTLTIYGLTVTIPASSLLAGAIKFVDGSTQ